MLTMKQTDMFAQRKIGYLSKRQRFSIYLRQVSTYLHVIFAFIEIA